MGPYAFRTESGLIPAKAQSKKDKLPHKSPERRKAAKKVGFSCSLRYWHFVTPAGAYTVFQSLSGFLARCDDTIEVLRRMQAMGFNPCRVFLLVAMALVFSVRVDYAMFQSLSGFLARCDINSAITYTSFSVLVSIPVGFSCSLRLNTEVVILASGTPFQSLSGFLARCDAMHSEWEWQPSMKVSIPVGFSCSLRSPA